MQKRASGGSRGSMNSSNNSRTGKPVHGALDDPQTYGMLLWQSKLQEKFLQEQKEKRQKELELQKRRAGENVQHEQPHPSSSEEKNRAQQHPSPTLEIPQMIPGPAPYTITPQTPKAPHSPKVQQTTSSIYSESMSNGPKTVPRFDQQPLFPNIPSRMSGSASCDNFGKLLPPPTILGNIVPFQQMGGAGSPRRSPSGRLLTVLRGDPEIRYHQKDTRGFDQTMRYQMDRDKVLEYKRDLDRQLEEKRKWRSRLGSAAIKEITRNGFIEKGDSGVAGNGKSHPSAASDHLNNYSHLRYTDRDSGSNKSGIELAPLMRKFNSLPKLNALTSTDVTRPYVHSPRNEFFHPVQPNEIAETLSSQLREKVWLTRRQKETERVATERHFQTWDSLWGRPGCGAPGISSAEKSIGHAVSFGNLYGSGSGLEQQLHKQNNNMGYNRVNLFKALHMTHQQPGRPK